MDYENARDEGNGIALGSAAPEIAAAAPTDAAPGRPGTMVPLQPDANNVVTLPAGVSLDDIKVQGRDLVIEMPDGRTMVITDGAVFVPVIAIDGVTVPPLNLAAYLNGETPQPAAGTVTSSGGNFADPTAPLQDAFGLGDLLPYTELNFAAAAQEEVIPNPVDEEPTTIIITPDQPAGATAATASVSEAGLPARGNESAGSNAAANSETTAGTIVFETPDGFGSISINGTVITQVGQTVTTAQGALTITSIAAGNIGYSYTLADNTSGDATSENFTVVVTDADGDAASATLAISIADDTPTANDDAATILEGDADNAITFDVDLNDLPGADSAASRTFASLTGTYGNLTLNADGTQTYTLNALGVTTINGLRPGQTLTDAFSYTLTDGDGDTDPAQLVITLAGANDVPIITNLTPAAQGGDATVDEDDLTAGSDATKESLTATGTFNISAPDGVGNVTVGGIAVIVNGQFQTGASGATPLGNTLTFTGYNAATGQISYSYTLTGNEAHAEGLGENSLFESFPVTLTDADGETATGTLAINIVDDVATAVADVAPVVEGGTVAGNVLTNDVFGADGATTTNPIGGVIGVRAAGGDTTTAVVDSGVGTTIAGLYGTLTLSADGKYTYVSKADGTTADVQDVFVYTIKDADGDLSTTTLTVLVDDVTAPPPPPVVTVSNNDVTVDESGLEGGSQIVPAGEFFTSGQITVTNASGPLSYVLTDPGNGLYGTLVLNGTTGAFSYTLDTPVDGPTSDNLRDTITGAESFGYQVKDGNGNVVGTGTISVDIVDDVPRAEDDAATIVEGDADNAITFDVDLNDVAGADGTESREFASLIGTYGNLTVNGNGTQTYTLNGLGVATLNGLKGDQTLTDTFSYTLTDGDGDTDPAQLVITLQGANDVPVITNLTPAVGGGDASVDEDDLLAGSDTDKESLTATGSFNISAPDGLDDLTVGGIKVIIDGKFQAAATATTPLGSTLTFTGFDEATGEVSYSYTLAANQAHGAVQGENSLFETFDVVLTDADGETDTDELVINIVDDVPTAAADVADAEEGATIEGNVLPGDVFGADGAATTSPVGGVVGVRAAGGDTTTAVETGLGTTIPGTYGNLTLTADGKYTYVGTSNSTTSDTQDVFVYTIKDGDGDLSTTTLTINVNDVQGMVSDNGVLVDESGLTSGSQIVPDGEFFTGGQITVLGAAGTLTYTLVSQANGTYGTLTLDSATGAYSYELDTTFDGPTSNNDRNTITAAEGFDYKVTDENGNTIGTGTIRVDIVDDVPKAENDTAKILEGAGNTVTFDVDLNDVAGADGTASRNFTSLTGTYGNITLNGDGTQTYTLNAAGITAINGLAPGQTLTDKFSYTLTDGDGDTDPAELVVTLEGTNDAPEITNLTPAADGGDASVDEDDLPAGSDTSKDSLTGTGTFNISAPDGVDDLTVGGIAVIVDGAFKLNATGTTLLGNTLTFTNYDATTGQVSYSYTLKDAETHAVLQGENSLFETFDVLLTDTDNEQAKGTLDIKIVDDVATANPDTGSVTEGSTLTVLKADGVLKNDVAGADGYAAGGAIVGVVAGTSTVTPVSGNVGGTIAGNYGTLKLNADGSYTYTSTADKVSKGEVDSFVYTIKDGDGDLSTTTLKITINDVTLKADNATLTVDEAALDQSKEGSDLGFGTVTGSLGTGSGDETKTGTLSIAGATFTAQTNVVTKYGLFSLDAAGNYTYTLTKAINSGAVAGANTVLGAETINYAAKDANGNSVAGTITVNIKDDVPSAVVPSPISVKNGAADPVSAALDPDASNNYGADGGTVRFSPSLNNTNSGLTSSFVPITYTVQNDQTLLGMAGATTIFKITLDPATSTYSVDMNGSIDSTTTIDFNAGGYNFVGGNNSWAGFIPKSESVGAPINNDSQDLLLTPAIGGKADGTINSNANTGGVADGSSVGSLETFRVDFVTDLRGDPADGAGDYDTAGNRDHTFDAHYTVNGASAFFQSSKGSIVRITAFDDPDGNTVVGDGAKDTITSLTIRYLGVASALITPTTTATTYTVNNHDFIVTLNGDGSVNVAGVAGSSGGNATGTVISVFTANGYNSIEYSWQDGDTFQIGDFGATTLTKNPVTFTVPVEVVDSDGDVSASSNLTITAGAIPPIVIDLDGDGAEFLARGVVAFDYGRDGHAEGTAWVGADDGLLAIDLDGDSKISEASEFVFGGNGLTDLEGLAARYDSNHDSVLDAADADFAKFGVWQDANSNGVNEAGEFRTLTELGITAIGLKSDGVTQTAAGGDVTVHGTASYTWADGTTGTLADASFATENEKLAARSAEIATVAAAAGALLAATSVAAQPAPEPGAADLPVAVEPTAPAAQQEDVAPASSPTATNDLLGSAPVPDATAAAHTTTASGEGEQAPASLGAGSEDHSALLPTGDAGETSDAAAASAGPALFGGNDGGAEMMSVLLAVGQAPAPAGAAQAEVGAAVVQEALAQAEDTQFVDHLVASLGTGDVPAATGGAGSETALSAFLAAHVSSGHELALAPIDAGQSMEDALALAAAA